MYLSLSTAKFNLFRSAQILTPPVFYRTGIMGEHHSVGSAISSIIPAFFILASSSSTFFIEGMGTLLAVCRL